MLNLCGIVVAILKMATGRNFSIAGINSRHHNLPTYEMSLKSDIVEFVQDCVGHFENYLPTYQILMISDNVEFLWPF